MNEMNEAFIYLIPKQDVPKKTSHLRSIALCKMVMKAITKIANKLKPLMEKLTRKHQANFISNIQGINNMVIVQEVIQQKDP